ncbi:hypothetical protein TUM4438_25290 [Shewanella sairae]|uniref:Uncharacterized protein n=1 Tax=Shewanella sairae TaxID=190310 RepID=A0ABQ4PHW5_9GAMM|nr:hypothetical protein TUM4438_25290 [Shewanella sairae]
MTADKLKIRSKGVMGCNLLPKNAYSYSVVTAESCAGFSLEIAREKRNRIVYVSNLKSSILLSFRHHNEPRKIDLLMSAPRWVNSDKLAVTLLSQNSNTCIAL